MFEGITPQNLLPPPCEAMLRVCYQRIRERSGISEAMSFEAWKALIAEQAAWPEFNEDPKR